MKEQSLVQTRGQVRIDVLAPISLGHGLVFHICVEANAVEVGTTNVKHFIFDLFLLCIFFKCEHLLLIQWRKVYNNS